MEGKREGNFTFLEGNSAEKKDKNEKFYFAEVEALSERDSDNRVFLLIFYKTSSCPCFNSILWFGFCDIPCIALDRTVFR